MAVIGNSSQGLADPSKSPRSSADWSQRASRVMSRQQRQIDDLSNSSAGGVSSVGVASTGAAAGAISVTGSPITGAGTIDLTPNLFTASVAGVVPASGGGSTNFLRADGNWASAGAGSVTSVGVASVGAAAAAISVSGSPVTGSGTIDLTPNLFTSSTAGMVPASGGGTTNFLRADGSWVAGIAGPGAAAAWVIWTGATSPFIEGDLNVSSVAFVSTGVWHVNFSSAILGSFNCVVGSAAQSGGNATTFVPGNPNSSTQLIVEAQDGGTFINAAFMSVVVFE